MYQKRYGTREEVYNGIARQTTGGLLKENLKKKQIANKTVYISVRLSESMKAADNLKLYRRNKKTKARKSNLGNTHNKTKKISFLNDKSEVKEYFYPELQGEDLESLREEYLREEEEDFGENKSVKGELTVQTIDNSDLDSELTNMFKSL